LYNTNELSPIIQLKGDTNEEEIVVPDVRLLLGFDSRLHSQSLRTRADRPSLYHTGVCTDYGNVQGESRNEQYNCSLCNAVRTIHLGLRWHFSDHVPGVLITMMAYSPAPLWSGAV
ncbi:MAG: hypothetical protein QF741_05015, partial [Candidatus Peribacteraceae bacterium]|nr:hypothetical protein [Candidatus Peribacteraceae bacterium]